MLADIVFNNRGNGKEAESLERIVFEIGKIGNRKGTDNNLLISN